MGPLPAKARRGGGLVGFHFFEIREARTPWCEGKATRARATNHLPFHNLSSFVLRRQLILNPPATGGTLQILQQPLFHVLGPNLQQKCYYCTSFRFPVNQG